jgi:hypothetical protein
MDKMNSLNKTKDKDGRNYRIQNGDGGEIIVINKFNSNSAEIFIGYTHLVIEGPEAIAGLYRVLGDICNEIGLVIK